MRGFALSIADTGGATRIAVTLFVLAMVAPIVALVMLPDGYGFYVFLPATPPVALDRIRVHAANATLLFAAACGVIAAIAAIAHAIRRRKWQYLIAPVVILLHPILQPVFFERADTSLNYRW